MTVNLPYSHGISWQKLLNQLLAWSVSLSRPNLSQEDAPDTYVRKQ